MDVEKLNELVEGKILSYSNKAWGEERDGDMTSVDVKVENGNAKIISVSKEPEGKYCKASDDIKQLREIVQYLDWADDSYAYLDITDSGDSRSYLNFIISAEAYFDGWEISDSAGALEAVVKELTKPDSTYVLKPEVAEYFVDLYDEAKNNL